MAYFYVEESSKVVAISSQFWDLAKLFSPYAVLFSEEWPIDKSIGEVPPEEKKLRQTIRGGFRPRPDLLTACHWQS